MDKERDQQRLEPAEGLRTRVGFNLRPSCWLRRFAVNLWTMQGQVVGQVWAGENNNEKLNQGKASMNRAKQLLGSPDLGAGGRAWMGGQWVECLDPCSRLLPRYTLLGWLAFGDASFSFWIWPANSHGGRQLPWWVRKRHLSKFMWDDGLEDNALLRWHTPSVAGKWSQGFQKELEILIMEGIILVLYSSLYLFNLSIISALGGPLHCSMWLKGDLI